MHRFIPKLLTLLVLFAPAAMMSEADARPARGGGGAARTSVNRGSYNRSANVNRNYNANRNVNRNVNYNRNVNVNVDRHYGGYGYGRGYGYGYGYGYHPVARAGAAVATAAVVGSVVASLPGSCYATNIGGVVYQRCGSAYYQPRYYGSSVSYVVVNPY